MILAINYAYDEICLINLDTFFEISTLLCENEIQKELKFLNIMKIGIF